MDPNSQNQEWSEWTFAVRDGGRLVPRKDVLRNAARWLRAGFGTNGVFKLERAALGWKIVLRVEGRPAGDPGYVTSVRRGFGDFVRKGWGPLASGSVDVKVLAGERRAGAPRNQWLEVPTVTF